MAEFTKERIIEELKASTQNASGMFEISEDTICALMSILTNSAPQLPQSAAGNEIREDFEAWARSAGFNENWYFFTNKHPNHYDDDHINDMWASWNACRAAMLQGAEPVSQRDEVDVPQQSESKDGTVTVYPWLVSISFFDKELHQFVPFSLVTHRYDDGFITKEDLHEDLREWIKGEIGDNLYTITFFGRMAPYSAPQQEANK